MQRSERQDPWVGGASTSTTSGPNLARSSHTLGHIRKFPSAPHRNRKVPLLGHREMEYASSVLFLVPPVGLSTSVNAGLHMTRALMSCILTLGRVFNGHSSAFLRARNLLNHYALSSSSPPLPSQRSSSNKVFIIFL